MKRCRFKSGKLKSFGDCFIGNKAGLHNVPPCEAEQSMLKVVAPTVSVVGPFTFVCLIEDLFDKLNHVFKELHGAHYVFILQGRNSGVNSGYLQGKGTANPHLTSLIRSATT